MLFYGHAMAAAGWLAACNHPLPFGVSVPDHLLDLACGDIPGGALQGSGQRKHQGKCVGGGLLWCGLSPPDGLGLSSLWGPWPLPSGAGHASPSGYMC